MAIYKTPDLSGKIINLTRTSYDAYSASGEIVTLHSSNERIKRPRHGTYYVVTKEQVDILRKTRTTRDLLLAVSQGACRDKKVLHKFISVNDSERVYPEGES